MNFRGVRGRRRNIRRSKRSSPSAIIFLRNTRKRILSPRISCFGNDLERLGKLFDAYPNVYVDIAAVLAELGRQPYSAHDFLIKYQDRVLMGKDIYDVNEYKWYFRALETR